MEAWICPTRRSGSRSVSRLPDSKKGASGAGAIATMVDCGIAAGWLAAASLGGRAGDGVSKLCQLRAWLAALAASHVGGQQQCRIARSNQKDARAGKSKKPEQQIDRLAGVVGRRRRRSAQTMSKKK